VMLVDAQLTRTNAGKSLTENQRDHKPLSRYLHHHEHAMHFPFWRCFKEAHTGCENYRGFSGLTSNP